jgi:hypothetical protein
MKTKGNAQTWSLSSTVPRRGGAVEAVAEHETRGAERAGGRAQGGAPRSGGERPQGRL